MPLFIVTMASQNVPGLAVLRGNGYDPDVPPIFVATGLASAAIALFGGHPVNLAAITAALCAGPEAHPDRRRRYLAAAAAGALCRCWALSAGFAAAFIAASPPLLIQAVAGLALLASLGGALSARARRTRTNACRPSSPSSPPRRALPSSASARRSGACCRGAADGPAPKSG